MSMHICKTCIGTGIVIENKNIITCSACDGVGHFTIEDKNEGGNTQEGQEAPSLTGNKEKDGNQR